MVAGVEARGFLFAAPLAVKLSKPLVPLRKAGKLPYDTHRTSYALEYGEAAVEVHTDAIAPGQPGAHRRRPAGYRGHPGPEEDLEEFFRSQRQPGREIPVGSGGRAGRPRRARRPARQTPPPRLRLLLPGQGEAHCLPTSDRQLASRPDGSLRGMLASAPSSRPAPPDSYAGRGSPSQSREIP